MLKDLEHEAGVFVECCRGKVDEELKGPLSDQRILLCVSNGGEFR